MKGKDGDLDWSDSRLEEKISSNFVSHLEGMLKNGHHDSSQTERRFDDTGSIFFFHDIDYLLFELNMLFVKFSLVVLNGHFNFTVSLEFILQS